ncbi:MAG TPA: hypothetical protein VIK89_02285 [Cytophagaceae bacterium]
MRKLFTLGLAMILATSVYFSSKAQNVALEKTYEISGKSKRGYLGKVIYDQDTKTYSLIYVTKANDKKAKFETYQFDKDFNFIDKTDEEIEFEKARSKFSWFNFKGEQYSFESVSVSGNLTGTLVLKKKKITYKWNWFTGSYDKHVQLLEKIKPKNDEGNKYYYHTHAEDDVNGDILVLVGVKDKLQKNSDPYRQFKDLKILKFNKDFDQVNESSIQFDYIQTLAFARFISKPTDEDEENAGLDGLALVFAPMGGPGMNKYADPNLKNYTYVRVADDGSIQHKIHFESSASYWKIDELVLDRSNNSVYLFGPAAEGKDKYYNLLLATTKFKAIQLMKIKDGQTEYLTSTNLDECAAKLKTPPSQKKSPEYEGKKFDIKGYKVGSNGEFFIYGQNFSENNNGKQYKDVIGFQFDKNGVLKSQFGVDTKENNELAKLNGAPQFFEEGNSGKNMYWILTEIDGGRGEDVGSAHARYKFLLYPRIGKIDMNTGTINDFVTLGKVDKKTFYLDNKFPFLPVDEGASIVFFGNDKPGKFIWFAKVNLD